MVRTCDGARVQLFGALGVGTEDRHRIVAVKPRRGGSQIALVSIQTGKK